MEDKSKDMTESTKRTYGGSQGSGKNDRCESEVEAVFSEADLVL